MKKRLAKLGIDPEIDGDSLTAEQKGAFARLDIDPDTIITRRVVDVNDRALRGITIGKGENEKAPRETGFDIAVASEAMAILALAQDLPDLRDRLGRAVVASSKNGDAITADDLGVGGAMTVLMKDALMPTLLQTLEGTPVFVHAGPFANIAHGNSSIVADKVALKMVGPEGFVITEAGFGADVGFEKFCDIKCRSSGLHPDCAVIVATVRALKLHGGGPPVIAGKPKAPCYTSEEVDLVEKGCCNLQVHVRNCRKYGLPVVVCVNRHPTDTAREIDIVCQKAVEAGANKAVCGEHWSSGGKGAVALAEAVKEACSLPEKAFSFLYPLDISIKEKISAICVNIYGAKDVEYSDVANAKVERFEKQGFSGMPICMAKTQYSLSHDADLKGAPTGFTVLVKDVRAAVGAGFIYPLLGPIMTMPGLPTRPAFYDVDIDFSTGKITGLF